MSEAAHSLREDAAQTDKTERKAEEEFTIKVLAHRSGPVVNVRWICFGYELFSSAHR